MREIKPVDKIPRCHSAPSGKKNRSSADERFCGEAACNQADCATGSASA
jgi:hypothetical protein